MAPAATRSITSALSTEKPDVLHATHARRVAAAIARRRRRRPPARSGVTDASHSSPCADFAGAGGPCAWRCGTGFDQQPAVGDTAALQRAGPGRPVGCDEEGAGLRLRHSLYRSGPAGTGSAECLSAMVGYLGLAGAAEVLRRLPVGRRGATGFGFASLA